MIKPPHIAALLIFPVLLGVIGAMCFYLESKMQPFNESGNNIPKKLEKLIIQIETGKVDLTKEKVLFLLGKEKNSKVATNKFIKEWLEVWNSLGQLLLIIALFQAVFVIYLIRKSKNKPNQANSADRYRAG